MKNLVVVIVPASGNEAEGKNHAVNVEQTPRVGDRFVLNTDKSYLVSRVVDDPTIQVVSVIYLDETTEEVLEAA